MTEVFGVPVAVLLGQLLLGLINGSFYALLSLGLAIIFGMLNVINFAHGAFYMLGGFAAWFLLSRLGLGYWGTLLAAPSWSELSACLWSACFSSASTGWTISTASS